MISCPRSISVTPYQLETSAADRIAIFIFFRCRRSSLGDLVPLSRRQADDGAWRRAVLLQLLVQPLAKQREQLLYLVALLLALAHRAPLPDAVGKREQDDAHSQRLDHGASPSVPLVGLGGAPG